jgi:hypothetical protein
LPAASGVIAGRSSLVYAAMGMASVSTLAPDEQRAARQSLFGRAPPEPKAFSLKPFDASVVD